jgi:hypothetical protein
MIPREFLRHPPRCRAIACAPEPASATRRMSLNTGDSSSSEQGVGSALFNFVLNGAIAWLLFRSFERVPLWGNRASPGTRSAPASSAVLHHSDRDAAGAQALAGRGKVSRLDWSARRARCSVGFRPATKRALVLGWSVCWRSDRSAYGALQPARGETRLAFWPFVGFKAARSRRRWRCW